MATIVFVIVAGIIYVISNAGATTELITENVYDSEAEVIVDSTEEPYISEKLCVHVSGAVNSPGVYEFDNRGRVVDAIDAAGGFADNADREYLNLAELLYDGQKIIVFTKKQVRNMNDSTNNMGVNINTASVEELMTLPGIGESKAKDIIAYRESNGRFKNIDDLKQIPGIKEGVFSKISDMITVN